MSRSSTMPNAIVASDAPIMLSGGRPAGRGEPVDADLEKDRAHFDSGALVRIEPDPDDLSNLTRDELNARATRAGVENPDALPNKAAVGDAIRVAEAAADAPKDS